MPQSLEVARDEEMGRLDVRLIAGDIFKWDSEEPGLVGEDVMRIGMMGEASKDRPFIYGRDPSSDVEPIDLVVVDHIGRQSGVNSRTLTDCVDDNMPGSETECSHFESAKRLLGNNTTVSAVTAECRLAREKADDSRRPFGGESGVWRRCVNVVRLCL